MSTYLGMPALPRSSPGVGGLQGDALCRHPLCPLRETAVTVALGDLRVLVAHRAHARPRRGHYGLGAVVQSLLEHLDVVRHNT